MTKKQKFINFVEGLIAKIDIDTLDADSKEAIEYFNILKSAEGDDSCCERFTYAYSNPIAGKAKFIHTYACDGNPLPSFEGEPKTLELPDVNVDELTDLIWNNLNEDNKVSLFVRYIDIASGESETRVVNKNK